ISAMRMPAALLIAAMTFAQSSKQIITTGPDLGLPFSPAVKADGLIYVPGTLATGANGQIVPGDVKTQTRQVLDNIAAILTAGGTPVAPALISRDGKDITVVKGDITAQTKTVLDNGHAILKAAGMTSADVVSARVFITDTAQFAAMTAAYRSYFPAAPPARATVKTALTAPDYLVEITMVAVKDPSRSVVAAAPNADGTPG